MNILFNTTDYAQTIRAANELNGQYDNSVIFHCYWNGDLNEKHLHSILSCYFFNVLRNKHSIILWVENNCHNAFSDEIKKYAEIRPFSLNDHIRNVNAATPIIPECAEFYFENNITYYSDFVRVLLLFQFGGVWFDLDCFFLRPLDPLFSFLQDKISLYQWGNLPWANNALYISLIPHSTSMLNIIRFCINRTSDTSYSFSHCALRCEYPLEITVLPCSWFDAGWITNPHNISFTEFFNHTDRTYNFGDFCKGAFCFHWHNQWNTVIQPHSICAQLIQIIQSQLHTK